MRRLVGLTAVVLTLAVPAAAFALQASSDDGTLSVKSGHGKVVLKPFDGSAIGRVATGTVVIVDPVFGDGGSADVWGCDKQSPTTSDHVTICSGTNLHLRIIDGKYKLIILGTGINLSAVGTGQVTLDGRGDDPSVKADGSYSLNDSLYKSLPDLAKTFTLQPAVGG